MQLLLRGRWLLLSEETMVCWCLRMCLFFVVESSSIGRVALGAESDERDEMRDASRLPRP